MESQNKQIKDYLNHGNKITSLEAFDMFNCMRLASRINMFAIHSAILKTIITILINMN